MTPQQQTWETYASAWKAPTADEKRALFAQSLSPDCVYTDPLTKAAGWDALCDYMLQFHQQVPGGHFVTVEFKTHHDCSVARWEMRGGDGTKLGDGISYGEFDDDGRLRTMTGFFDTP